METKLNLRVEDVQEDHAIKVEIEDTELLITKKNGNIYAVSDRCGHMNVSLSEGKVSDGVVTCPMHKAQFDVQTGGLLSGPKVPKMLSPTKMGKLMNQIKVHNLPTYAITEKDGELYIDL